MGVQGSGRARGGGGRSQVLLEEEERPGFCTSEVLGQFQFYLRCVGENFYVLKTFFFFFFKSSYSEMGFRGIQTEFLHL